MDVIGIIRIRYKEIEYRFKETMRIWEYHKWRKQFGTDPVTTDPGWWLTKTEFGEFLLKKLLIDIKTLEIPEEDWKIFHPVFEHYFVTPLEFDAIKNNVLFWNGKSQKVYENNSFIDWVLTTEYQILTDEDRLNMGFKNQMILYYYTVLNKVTQNAQEFANRLGYIPTNEEKEPEDNMYG